MTVLLSAKLLCYSRQTTCLFADVSFELNEKQVLVVEGKNGSGKSTLLRMLAGITSPLSGSIIWKNLHIHHNDSDYCENIIFISHHNGLKLGLSVEENIELMQHLTLTKSISIAKALDELQLSHKRHSLVKELSAGQKRRVALAKLFLSRKPLWILDEPFTALDADTQAFLANKITEHVENNGSVILTSHQTLNLPGHIDSKALRLTA